MLIRLIDPETNAPFWLNAAQVLWVEAATPEVTRLALAGGAQRNAQGSAAELATQLQDAFAGRKYVDFWAS
jgi:hypothetical protein